MLKQKRTLVDKSQRSLGRSSSEGVYGRIHFRTWPSLCSHLTLFFTTFGALQGCTVDRNIKIKSQQNSEVKELFDADQKDRAADVTKMTEAQGKKWAEEVGPRDAERRKRVHTLLEQSALQTGEDFERAAFIFQHGFSSDDFLLAHIVGMVAVSKGDAKARWIAAASLDRYLLSLQQRQVFGSQVNNSNHQPGHWTLEPFNKNLVPDSVRHLFCSPDVAAQEKAVNKVNAGADVQAPDVKQFDAACN
jgi:hypothetical protein